MLLTHLCSTHNNKLNKEYIERECASCQLSQRCRSITIVSVS